MGTFYEDTARRDVRVIVSARTRDAIAIRQKERPTTNAYLRSLIIITSVRYSSLQYWL